MGNEANCRIEGMRDIQLEINTGCKLILKDVRHVTKIQFNLISIGKLDDQGYSNHLGDGKLKLCKGSLVLAGGNKSNTLYKTDAILVKRDVNIV